MGGDILMKTYKVETDGHGNITTYHRTQRHVAEEAGLHLAAR